MESNLKNYEGECPDVPGQIGAFSQIEKEINYLFDVQASILERLLKVNDFLFKPEREKTPSTGTENAPGQGELYFLLSKLEFAKERIIKISKEVNILCQLLP